MMTTTKTRSDLIGKLDELTAQLRPAHRRPVNVMLPPGANVDNVRRLLFGDCAQLSALTWRQRAEVRFWAWRQRVGEIIAGRRFPG